MGNASTKESRPSHPGGRNHPRGPMFPPGLGPPVPSESMSSRRNRVSRGDLTGILGMASTGGDGRPEPPYERRETKQEREARRLERERVARLKERERSLKEEHVDGGYLVTLGTYTGPEDFNKQIVRQLQIERKLAPFWRGLNDIDDKWAEHQIIAAARGLPIPPADQTPPEELVPRPLAAENPSQSAQNLNSLTVPIGGRSLSATSEHSATNVGSALPSPISIGPILPGSSFKPRGKALAAVLGGTSRNGSTTDIVPREINLPNDPFVNGQPIEVFLYKDATECPICFLSYPPYLNHTRCCDQAICSECFVQIKRPDPYYPEGHNENDPNHNPEEQAGLLVCEPACCPYCTQPDFGVTFEPPPFRRGLTYTVNPSTIGSLNTAMSSTSSLNSNALSPSLGSPLAAASRRRTQSLSANAANVILTDRVRPDWSTRLQAARAHQARRAAAATALHTAAFLMGGAENRSFRVGRFSRRNTGTSGSGVAGGGQLGPGDGTDNLDGGVGAVPSRGGPEPGPRGSSGRGILITGGPGHPHQRSRMEDLEEMMFMEAIRLSLAAEEERKRKAEKEERKEAKKREKEERKAAKAAAKSGPYGSGDNRSGHSSASGSSLSLPGLGLGRKRGNSGASNLRVEASVANAMATSSGAGSDAAPKDKGKAIDRGLPSTPEDGDGDLGSDEVSAASTNPVSTNTTSAPRPIAAAHHPAGPSHLRQMSNASSVASSLPDSQAGSYSYPSHLHLDPSASGLSLGSRSGASEDGGDHEGDRDRNPSASTEPMFNFRSLAEVVGVSLEGENAGRRLSRIKADAEQNKPSSLGQAAVAEQEKDAKSKSKITEVDDVELDRVEDVSEQHDGNDSASDHEDDMAHTTATLRPEGSAADDVDGNAVEAMKEKVTSQQWLAPPELTITPDTPAALDQNGDEVKQLGFGSSALPSAAAAPPHQRQVTQ